MHGLLVEPRLRQGPVLETTSGPRPINPLQVKQRRAQLCVRDVHLPDNTKSWHLLHLAH